jgi:hypothetical protein
MASQTKADHLFMYIGGEWVDSVAGETFERISPVTGEVLATLAWQAKHSGKSWRTRL